MSDNTAEKKPLRIKLVRSGIGFPEKQKLVIKSLGFKRLNQVVVRSDTPQIRGMVFKIRHLVEIIDD
jgi:large subunit ribosomal protein L30